MSEEWTVVFRFGDGGRNTAGRPGRTVIVAVFVRTSEVQGCDLAGLLHCRQVDALLTDAFVRCPTPKPDPLEFEFEESLIKAEPVLLAEVVKDGRLFIEGPDSLNRAAGIFAHLPENHLWLVKLGWDNTSGEQAEIRRVTPVTHPPPIPTFSPSSAPQGTNRTSGLLGRCIRHAARGIRSIWRRPLLRILMILGILAIVLIQLLTQSGTSGIVKVDRSEKLRPYPFPANPPEYPNIHDKRFNHPAADEARSSPEKPPVWWRTWLAEFKSALRWFVLGAIFGGFGVSIWKRKKNVGK